MPYMQSSASYEKRLLPLQCTLTDAGIGFAEVNDIWHRALANKL